MVPEGAVSTVALINSGGPSLCGYMEDSLESLATIGLSYNLLGGTKDSGMVYDMTSLARTTRSGLFSYRFPSKVGNRYFIRLWFSETWWKGPPPNTQFPVGRRAFHVSMGSTYRVQGIQKLVNIDPLALAGGKQFTLTTQSFDYLSLGDYADIIFYWTIPPTDFPSVAAVEVYDMGPQDMACSGLQPTAHPPTFATCHDMVPEWEIERGLGAYYDPNSQASNLGSWAVSFELNRPFCVQCRWANNSVYGYLRPSQQLGTDSVDIVDCPPCVATMYQMRWPWAMPQIPPLPTAGCPAGWVSGPGSSAAKCYWRSPISAALPYQEAKQACKAFEASVGGSVQMLRVQSADENTWLQQSLMWWNGFGSDVWLGLYKAPNDNGLWRWSDGTILDKDNDFQYWGPPGSFTPGHYEGDPDPVLGSCVKYLPHVDPTFNTKHWIVWGCDVRVPYICERTA